MVSKSGPLVVLGFRPTASVIASRRSATSDMARQGAAESAQRSRYRCQTESDAPSPWLPMKLIQLSAVA
jgi:hypothetical protein